MMSSHEASPHILSAARPIITTIVIELDNTRAAGLITSPCLASLIAVTTGPTNGIPSIFPRRTPRHNLPRNVRPGPNRGAFSLCDLVVPLNIGMCVGVLANVAAVPTTDHRTDSASQDLNFHVPRLSGASYNCLLLHNCPS